MNWGKSMMLVLVLFAVMMACFLVVATRNPEPLVTERYYEQELVYQQRIDAMKRTEAIGTRVRIAVSRQGVELLFPIMKESGSITGELHLLRPNDPADDRRIKVEAEQGVPLRSEALALRPGLYVAKLEWGVGGVMYYTEEKVVVP